MRLEDCKQIWHGFGVLHRHLLLIMVFDCPLWSIHMRCFWAYLYLFLFLGGEFIFCWLELVELFRLYLAAIEA